jgi:hypothetical protein
MTLAELLVKIKVDQDGLAQGLDKAKKTSQSAESDIVNSFKKIGIAAAAAFGIHAFDEFISECVKAAAGAANVQKRFNTTFSTMQEEAKHMSEDVAHAYGLTDDAAQNVMATSGFMIESFGASQKAALKMSAAITGLAVDMASFAGNGATVEGAAEAITRALAGQTRGLREYNIALQPEQIKQFAESQGKVYDALTKTEQAEITLMAIQKAASGVIGDYSKNQYSYGNQVRISKMLNEELRETIGNKLLPIYALATRAHNDMTKEMIKNAQAVNDWISKTENMSRISSAIGALSGVFSLLKSNLAPVAEELFSASNKMVNSFKNLLPTLSSTTDKFSIFSSIMGVLSLGLQFTVMLVSNISKDLMNLAVAAIYSGGAIIQLGRALSGDIKWSEFKASSEEAKKKLEALGQGIIDSGKYFEKFGGKIKDFAKDQKTAMAEAAKSTNDVKKAVEDSFKSKEAIVAKENVQHRSERQDLEDKLKLEQDADKDRGTRAAIYKAQIDRLGFSFEDMGERAEIAGRVWDNMTAPQKLQTFNSAASAIVGGISGMFASLSALIQASTQSGIDALNREMIAAEEAAGVADDTATEKAQKEYDLAVAGGDAIVIAEKQKALQKAKIEEEYEKKKQILAFKGAHAAWELQVANAVVQGIVAPLNAYASAQTWAAAIPFGAGEGLALGLAALVAAAAGVSVAASIAAEPKAPKFASGGIIPGSVAGMNIIAGENSKSEIVANQGHIEEVWNMMNGQGDSGKPIQIIVQLGDEVVYDRITKGSNDGMFVVNPRVVHA